MIDLPNSNPYPAIEAALPYQAAMLRTLCVESTLKVTVILEVATLNVLPGQTTEFEQAFGEAQKIISSMPGYISHELQRCVEIENQCILLVRWKSIEAHEVGFRQAPEYQQWKKLLHHFYSPFPSVQHYEQVY